MNDDYIPLPEEPPEEDDPYAEPRPRAPEPWRPRIVTDDEAAPDVVPAATEPMAVARHLLAEHTDPDGHILIRRWRGDWWRYRGPHWCLVEPEAVRKMLYERLEDAVCFKYDAQKKTNVATNWAPDKGKIDRVIDALAAPTLLDAEVDAPSWLSTGESASGLVPCANGLVDVRTGVIRDMTADYFGTVAVPFSYDPRAPEPKAWLAFLRTLWPTGGDDGEIRLVQEWFGYVLSGRCDLQKMLLMVGPPRSGKGTIAGVLTALLGEANRAAPTLGSMTTNFGLAPLIGKPLAVIGDARLASSGQEAVVERLLSISGQDSLTIDRKNRSAWTGTLPTRIMVSSNELPRFADASSAIASRFVVLTFRESFLGREDVHLGRRLMAELPSILRWALEGLRRLQGTHKLTEPPASLETIQRLHDLISPVGAFTRDACVLDPKASVPFSTLYGEYETWCEENGRGKKSAAAFSSDLTAAHPHLKTDHRPRDEENRKMPRHVVGATLSAEWRDRVKDARSGGRW